MLNYTGYIEGYYGKLLNWRERKKIINLLHKLKFNVYFYAPKEDICHRFKWRKNYSKAWSKSFKNFCRYAKSLDIKVIAGISPGLDFDFTYNNNDLNILKNKLIELKNLGAYSVSILFDDIQEKLIKHTSEGKAHADLSNKINFFVKDNLSVVPRIYADEIENQNGEYLREFLKYLNKNILIHYTGKTIISSKFSTMNKILNQRFKENKILYWCNYYSNDYCPKKIFIGPPPMFDLKKNIMFNLTGMINTDLLILKTIKGTYKVKNIKTVWKNILIKEKIPKQFFNIYNFFEKPYFTNNYKINKIEYDEKTINDLDFLLWSWKSDLSLEWYSFLFNLKQDLQILMKKVGNERILKSQTYPLQQLFLEKE